MKVTAFIVLSWVGLFFAAAAGAGEVWLSQLDISKTRQGWMRRRAISICTDGD